MTLPPVKGWIIDFRTARAIFGSGSNQRISHCVGLCKTGKLFISHTEEDFFKGDPKLKPVFLDGANCVLTPDDEVMAKCCQIAQSPIARNLVRGNNSAVFISATAAVMDFGVISDHSSVSFATVADICLKYGIPIKTADQYFDEAV